MVLERGSAISKAAYALGIMFLVSPALNFVTAWPLRFGAADWRFQQFATLAAALPPALLGIGIIVLTARSLEHRVAQIVIGIISLLTTLLVAGLLASFLLDALELRARIAAAGQGPLTRVAVKVLLECTLALPTLLLLGVAGIRVRKRVVKAARGPADSILIRQPIETAGRA